MSKITRIGSGVYSMELFDDEYDEFVIDFNRWRYDYKLRGESIMVTHSDHNSHIMRHSANSFSFKHAYPEDERSWHQWTGDGMQSGEIERIYQLYLFDKQLEEAIDEA